jgi:glutamyl-tRNA(Gln) amidotransferase subunit D
MSYKALLKKFKVKEGDLVKVTAKETDFTGHIIPSTEANYLILKAPNGYNAGFKVSEVKKIEKKGEKKKVGVPKTKKLIRNPKKPLITILHTGGTIASRVDYSTGGVFASFKTEDLLTMFPELGAIANFEAKLISNMMSEDMLFTDYQKIAQAIAKEVKRGVDGVIIGHGTDTIAITAAALAFALEDIQIPVILVGAQRSSDRGSSDAAMNLVCAAEFIAKTDFVGVGLCMHESTQDNNCVILPATKTRKLHTSRRDAFKAVNTTPIARIDFKSRKIDFLGLP